MKQSHHSQTFLIALFLISNSLVSGSQIAFKVQDQRSGSTSSSDQVSQRPLQSSSTWNHHHPSPSTSTSNSNSTSNSIVDQPLHGRFLHITDLHPDPYYKPGSAVSSACHWNKPKKSKKAGKQRAGYWGTGPSDCDSPPHLITSSLDWISQNWLPSSSSNSNSSSASLGLDFIIWTGDSARHDIDNKLPRSSKEIFELNLWTLNSLKSRFPKTPIIPTLGNNDIFPHNIMFKGPNSITKNLYSIWKDFIPEFQFHTFQYGAYFSNEVIRNQLAVISLNTIFWFNSNKVVDGCRKSRRSENEEDRDPGTNQLDWLEVQLEQFRSRSMQVHLIGHVPPASTNYFPRCFDRYTDMVLRYQDTIVGQHFGHSNIDAFYLQEEEEKKKRKKKKKNSKRKSLANRTRNPNRDVLDAYASKDEELDESESNDHIDAVPEVEIRKGSNNVVKDLKESYESIPGKRRTDLDRWLYFFVAPSIVPTSFPSIRVWTYNISREARVEQMQGLRLQGSSLRLGMGDEEGEEDKEGEDNEEGDDEEGGDDEEDSISEQVRILDQTEVEALKRKKKRPKDNKKKKKRKPRYTSPTSPSRSNTYLSLLGYSQWTLDIIKANRLHDELVEKSRSVGLIGSGDRGGDEEGWERETEMEGLNKRESLDYRLEYSTYKPEELWKEFVEKDAEEAAAEEFEHIPVPKHLLQKELSSLGVEPPTFQHLRDQIAVQTSTSSTTHPLDDENEPQTETSSRKNKTLKLPKELRHFTDYSLPSINVEEILNLARRLVTDEEMWSTYKRRIYSGVE